jgi:hypothetical protein
MYKVEFRNDSGDWIHTSWHKNEDHARIVAEVKGQSGYKSRVLHNGKIIFTVEAES